MRYEGISPRADLRGALPLRSHRASRDDGGMTDNGPFEFNDFNPANSSQGSSWRNPSDEDFRRQGYAPNITPDERTWAMLAHLSAIIAWFLSVGSISFVGPLLVWIFKKDTSPYVRQASAQSFNFNLGMALMTIIGWILVATLILLPIGFILIGLAWVLQMYHHIKATISASNNKIHHYPFQIKILS